jgi:ABC-type sulfate transport system permease component
MAIAVFYLRVFPGTGFRLAVKLIMVYLVLYTIIFLSLIIFQCSPVNYAWDKTLDGKCINMTALTYAGSIFATITDIGLILLPVNELRKLQMGRVKKFGVMVIFIVGCL